MRVTVMFALAGLLAIMSAEAASAASCSSWKAVCIKRSNAVNPAWLPECDAKFSTCLSSGCFTEGAGFGGASHCGLTKN